MSYTTDPCMGHAEGQAQPQTPTKPGGPGGHLYAGSAPLHSGDQPRKGMTGILGVKGPVEGPEQD